MDVFGLLDRARSLNARAVQLCDNLPWIALSHSDIKDIAAHASKYDLEIELGIKGRVEDIDASLIEKAIVLRSKIIRIVVNYFPGSISFNEIMASFKNIMKEMANVDISIAIENHFSYPPAQWLDLISTVDHPHLGICLDPVNAVSTLSSPDESVDALSPHAISVHAKDISITRLNTGFYISGCPLGEGIIDWKKYMGIIYLSPHTPNIFVENWMDKASSEEETLCQEHQWVVSGMEYLQNLIKAYAVEVL
jgi:sugar phosphate isomerase/epimerase